MTIRAPYLIAAAAILELEIGIAAFVPDGPVRTHVGDSLAVILLWLMLRALTQAGPLTLIAAAFAIATGVELAQWLGMADRLGLHVHSVARILLGSRFDPWDLLAYCVGAIAALAIEAVAAPEVQHPMI